MIVAFSLRAKERGWRVSNQNEKRPPIWIARGPPEPNVDAWPTRPVGWPKAALFRIGVTEYVRFAILNVLKVSANTMKRYRSLTENSLVTRMSWVKIGVPRS